MFRIIKKKHGCYFRFQNVQKVQKMFRIKKKTTVTFLSKSEQKTIRHNFLQL